MATTRVGNATNSRASHHSLQSGQNVSLAKTLQVQDQIIEELRADQSALREALETERFTLRECRIDNDRDLKALQRENVRLNKTVEQQRMKIEELEKESTFAKESLETEQRNLKNLEKEHANIVKELRLKNSKEFDKANKQESIIDRLKSEIADLKESLESERNAVNLLIREHNAEVRMLREEVKAKSTEVFREFKDRATRERDEYREMQEEAERTYRLLEKDFREALASKDEELKKVKAEAKSIQKELKHQLRALIKEPISVNSDNPREFVDVEKTKLKREINVLKHQNRKLLNELATEDEKTESGIKSSESEESKMDVNRMMVDGPENRTTILKLQRDLSDVREALGNLIKNATYHRTVKKTKPALPIKQVKLIYENNINRTTHVKDIVRRLQERGNAADKKPNFIKSKINNKKTALQDEGNNETNKTIEDLKAIDEDIEKLRKQIEERDKIIIALREAAEAKDKKLDGLMVEISKLQSITTTGTTNLPASPSPPLCTGELCWTDGFVDKNYHEPVYIQLLNDHVELQKVCDELKEKLESIDENRNVEKRSSQTRENAINLIMAEQIRMLKEREAQLMSEAEELREQNDLMEFRILELEECQKEEITNKQRTDKSVWSERDIEDISDSGVMSLPTSEDLTSDSELGDAIRNYSSSDNLTFNSSSNSSHVPENSSIDLKQQKKLIKSTECLQESGIFEESEISPNDSLAKYSKSCQTESILDKTLLDIIDSSCDLFISKNRSYFEEKTKSDDLTTEISKLTEIQKRIQQKNHQSDSIVEKSKNQESKEDCQHWKSIGFYEERLSQLEDKIRIYESSKNTKDILLAKRLEKEIDLAHKVKELTGKISALEIENRKLEEEKCEFEEAENDTRFQCQRLEIKLQELIEKNAELEVELERQKNIMTEDRRRARRKGNLEELISKYEKRNSELEERETEARQRLNMMEIAMPAILAWNVFKICRNGEKSPTERADEKEMFDEAIFRKLEELMEDQRKLGEECEKAEEREKILKEKIEELEKKAAEDRKALEEITSALRNVRESGTSSESIGVFEELKKSAENEIEMRKKIEDLEKSERAYMTALHEADEIWAGMESDYKTKLAEAEKAGIELRKKVSELEETISNQIHLEEKNSKLEELTNENRKLTEKLNQFKSDGDSKERISALENENSKLKNEIENLLEELRKYETLENELELTKEQFNKEKKLTNKLSNDLDDRNKNFANLELALNTQIVNLTQELAQKMKEISCLEVTVAELREEVETLENKVSELIEIMQNAKAESVPESTEQAGTKNPSGDFKTQRNPPTVPNLVETVSSKLASANPVLEILCLKDPAMDSSEGIATILEEVDEESGIAKGEDLSSEFLGGNDAGIGRTVSGGIFLGGCGEGEESAEDESCGEFEKLADSKSLIERIEREGVESVSKNLTSQLNHFTKTNSQNLA